MSEITDWRQSVIAGNGAHTGDMKMEREIVKPAMITGGFDSQLGAWCQMRDGDYSHSDDRDLQASYCIDSPSRFPSGSTKACLHKNRILIYSTWIDAN